MVVQAGDMGDGNDASAVLGRVERPWFGGVLLQRQMGALSIVIVGVIAE